MDKHAATEPPPRAGRKEWIGLAVLALPTLLLALDLSVIYLALPHLSADIGASSLQQLWISDIYGFMMAGFLVTMGTLGDRIGRRRLVLIGGAAFGAVSVLAAYSVNAEMLIVSRALMGVAGATLMPSTLALISNMFRDSKQRTVAISVWMSCFMGGAAIGPVIGGALLEAFWWGSVFLLGVPVMALLLVAAPILLPEYRDKDAGSLDLISVVLSLGTVLLLIYAMKETAQSGPSPVSLAAALVGLLVGVLFVRRQRRLTSPLIDLRLFASLAFSAALVILMISVATQGGNMLLVTQYLQMVEGLSPLWAGMWLVPSSLAMVAGSLLAPAFAQRIPRAFVIAGGMALATVGYVLLALVPSTGGLPLLITGASLVFFGIGLVGALITDLVVGAAPPAKAGAAASLSQTSGDFGIALGVAVFGSVGAAVYRSQMVEGVPAGVSAGDADAARESIAGAVATAGELSGPLGGQLSDAAREAFTSGLNTSAAVSGVLAVVLAVLALVALRKVTPPGAPAPQPAGEDRHDDTHRLEQDVDSTTPQP
ncbi:MFS transporter [Nocardiopsis ansamitocini]|uniref:MFS transporter n=1 Tax=Nocardiopsis ansamitocini TaxID=1670832 RepID=A0A9W6P7X8_9ACTN|nr:MFS transporter [Nocardiopsis ansamitocini]GLU48699.1 MFS transporter [Nocardiopsis ansamitocini]